MGKSKYTPKLQKEITDQYVSGIPMLDIVNKHKMSKRTFYRIIRDNGVEPYKYSPEPAFLINPKIKKYTPITNTHKHYKADYPASERQIKLFNKLTNSNITETDLTFYEISDIIQEINKKNGYNIGDGWKTRLPTSTYLKNRSQEIIDIVLELTKHATLIEHENGNRYFTVGEMPAISVLHYDSYNFRAIRFIREFEKFYWKYIMWINYRFEWRYRLILNRMGIPLTQILSKEISIQTHIYDIFMEYLNEQGVKNVSFTTILEKT